MPKFDNLKSTLNLPRTDFPMKASLPLNEPEQLAEWEEKKLYHRIQQARADAPSYVLHDGPPYPTGTIHLGTGLNKILKDMVVKSKTMAGFRAPYVPGWDCHGLPIETQVEKELGGKKGSVPPGEFRRMCREFASRYVDQHRRDFKRLGVLGQWEDPYLTMSPQYEATIADAFITFLERGYVYRGLKPVYWCIFDRTALAEAEVEYEDHTSPSIYVRYKLVPGSDSNIPEDLKGKNVYAVIWTTTPWTIPASMALAFNPHHQYSAVEIEGGDVYILAQQRRHEVAAACGYVESGRVFGTYSGRDIVETAHLVFQHPFLDRLEPAVLADYVELDQGTGVVHTAPGHGVEDYQTGQKYGIAAYAPIDDDGRFIEGLPEYKGKSVFEAKPVNYPIAGIARSTYWARKTLAQLSALLALPQSGYFPGHGTVVHRPGRNWHRRGRDPLARACGNLQGEVDAGMGRRANLFDDRGATGLVRFAAKILGRAARDLVLRQVWQTV